jgi:hypothetical protein
MAVFQPYKHLLRGATVDDDIPSLEDGYRLRQRERGRRTAQRPLQSNALGNALAGYRTASPGRLSGGKFTPRATSGTL